MSEERTFFAPGLPRPKGNHAAVCPRRNSPAKVHNTPCKPYVTEDYRGDAGKKLKAWERALRVASREVAPPIPFHGPMRVDVIFFFPQPKSKAKEEFPEKSPGDLDKLLRAVGDSLQAKTKGYLMRDDNQIVDIRGRARWARDDGPGALVTVEALAAQQLTLI